MYSHFARNYEIGTTLDILETSMLETVILLMYQTSIIKN
jgi:hypothetical protein